MTPSDPQYITVTRGLAGYFAVHIHTGEIDGTTFPEPWKSGIGRYSTYAEAEEEAKGWAEDEGMEFRPGKDEGDLADTGMNLGEYLRKYCPGVTLVEPNEEGSPR